MFPKESWKKEPGACSSGRTPKLSGLNPPIPVKLVPPILLLGVAII
jgi:hypothetical protein